MKRCITDSKSEDHIRARAKRKRSQQHVMSLMTPTYSVCYSKKAQMYRAQPNINSIHIANDKKEQRQPDLSHTATIFFCFAINAIRFMQTLFIVTFLDF